MAVLDFEKNIEALTNKIEDLKKLAREQSLDLNDEILMMEQKLISMEKEVYSNLDAWEKLTLVRRGERPSGYDYIQRIFTNFIEFHGDRAFGDDASIAGGIAYLDDMPVTVIAQVKGKNTKEKIKRNFGQPNPEGYRKALRLMKQAEKFKRPVICFVDTPGAFCGIGAEERGQGEAIARNLMSMSSLKTPIISILIGEGGSGGALALAVADKVCMLEHSIYSILSPEGFASILWRDGSRAKEAANIMKITAQDLYELGIIDEIINEPLGGAHKDVDKTAENIKNTISRSLNSLNKLTEVQLIEERYNKFRKMGKFIE